MKFGIIGGGRWAQVHRSALADAGAELACVLVGTPESAERLQGEWGVPAVTSLQQFLQYDFDAAIVASPNYLHADHAVACLVAGLHTLVEKPMAVDQAGCERIIAAAAKAGKVAAVGLEMRFFKLFSRVRSLLEDGAVGQPLHLRLDLWRRPYRTGAGGWKTDPAKLGSTILEEPVHYLDLVRWLLVPSLGEPTELQAWATGRSDSPTAWENLDIRLGFGGTGHAFVTRSVAAWGHHVKLQIVGTDGSLQAFWNGAMDLDPHPIQVLRLKRGHDINAEVVSMPVAPSGHAFDVPAQTLAFIAAIRGEKTQLATPEDGRASVALCLAVEQALAIQSPIRL